MNQLLVFEDFLGYLLCVILNGPIFFFFPLVLGPFLEIGGERDHCLGREITSRLDPFLGLVGKIFDDLIIYKQLVKKEKVIFLGCFFIFPIKTLFPGYVTELCM